MSQIDTVILLFILFMILCRKLVVGLDGHHVAVSHIRKIRLEIVSRNRFSTRTSPTSPPLCLHSSEQKYNVKNSAKVLKLVLSFVLFIFRLVSISCSQSSSSFPNRSQPFATSSRALARSIDVRRSWRHCAQRWSRGFCIRASTRRTFSLLTCPPFVLSAFSTLQVFCSNSCANLCVRIWGKHLNKRV